MKTQVLILFTICVSYFAQAQHESLHLPSDCAVVGVIDLQKIAQKVTTEEMEDSEFISSFLRDIYGSHDPALHIGNSGLNPEKTVVFFSGKRGHTTFKGATFSIVDRRAFFNAQPEINRAELETEGKFVDAQRLWILSKDEITVLKAEIYRPKIKEIADSIFLERGWENPNQHWFDHDFSSFEWDIEEEAIFYEEEVDEYFEDAEIIEEEDGIDWNLLYDTTKDSIEVALLREAYLHYKSDDAFKEIGSSEEYKYLNSGIERGKDIVLMLNYVPEESGGFDYKGPIEKFLDNMLDQGSQIYEFDFTKTGMDIDMISHMGENRLQVMEAASKQKPDKNLLNYIPANNQGFMTANLNSKASYEKIKELFLPQLESSEEGEALLVAAVWKLIDALVDDNTLFGLIPSSSIFSFNGMREMEVETVTFDYDEDEFEYKEIKTTEMQSLPVFTFGMQLSRSDLVENFLRAFAAMEGEWVMKEAGYYQLKEGPIKGIPIYLAIVDEIMLFTNDQDLVSFHLNGYDKKSLSSSDIKAINQSPLMYGKMDWQQLPEELSSFFSSSSERKMLELLSDKTGSFELTSTISADNAMHAKISYTFHDDFRNGAHYAMEVLKPLFESMQE